ncbi:serine/threonine protein kinase [Nocardioides guangzhouensis]|uniref:non-specific serine/threonine protein kinase n=1 Tax=Nocardioides guangzhouensis TaxID=2497878 RepID=A0A4Q4ZCX9_9ACTN|nr:serine/threonine-protein kinase [Nocardioides guangzhouensis]RYP85842.1 serine/threonine protein kinase [Nocardioides guangzhouensis]
MTESGGTDAARAAGSRVVADRYRLEREVGRGGMGSVWLGSDTVLHRQVALKQIGRMPGADQPDGERVRREARVSAMLNHENVVAVFDLVETADQHWLVMEYLESLNLAQRIRRDGPLPPDEAAALLAQAAQALAVAHRSGIVHRDVKPSNMLVTDDGLLKLGDFGIARAKSDVTLTQTGLVTGSPSYLAPEVAAGQGATTASDVWSLGATLFHAVAGHPPYDATENLMGTLYRIVHEEPPRTDRAGWLDPVLRATMHRDPAGRWTAEQVALFLAHGPADPLADEPSGRTQVMPAVPVAAVAAPPDDPPPATQTQVVGEPVPAAPPAGPRRGRRTPIVAAAAVLLLLAVVLGGWLLTRGDDEPNGASGSGAGPSEPTSQAAKKPAKATAQGMEDFITSYLATVTQDPATTWKQLTPSFQQASGGFGSYSGYWGTIASATPSNVQADPQAMTVSYHVEYVRKDGSKVSDDVTLGLVFEDGTYLVNEEF